MRQTTTRFLHRHRRRPSSLGLLVMASSSLVSAALADSEAVQPEINEVEIGAGYVSDDSYRFGRYTGLEEEGAYIIGDVKARQYRDDAYNWRLRGTNLGLDSRYLRLEGGKQGAQEVYIEYQKMPNYINDSGATPFSGAGSSNLTLPPGFDINTNLDQNLVGLDRETERERYGVGTSIIPRRLRNWNFRVAYQHETKQGTSAIGGSMGGSFPALTGNTTAAILPQPIDYVTDLVDLSLAYAKDRTQLEFSYHMSLFDNQERSLDWQDPFAPSRLGSQALAPRNQFHQFTAKGGYQLAANSRLTGVFSIGRMTQDWNYQAYATLPPGLDASLPRDSLDGEVWLKTARLDLTSRPMPRLRLNAAYRYHERDNDTSSATYDYFIADSTTPTIAPVTNRPLSYRRHNLDLDASYRANQMVSLAGNLGFNGVRREYDNTDANDNDEYIAGARLKFYPNSELDAEVYAEHSRRDVSDYSNTPGVIPDFENPALRYYYIADRNRDRLGLRLSYMPYEKVTLGFNIDYNKDDYDDSDIGLTESKTTAYTWDIAYLPKANITTRAYYTVEKIKSDQAGSESGLPTPDWFADLEDRFITLGLGGEIRDIRGRVDLGMDYVFSKSTGEIDLSAEDGVSSAASLGQYPDLETILNSLKVYARYKHSETITLKLSYWYQNYDADNWALDDVGQTTAPDTLLLGENVQDYTVHLVAASAAYRF